MRFMCKGLSTCLALLIASVSAAILPAYSQDSPPNGVDNDHPLRLQRPDNGDEQSPSNPQYGRHLQGGVSRIGVFTAPDGAASGLSNFDWKQAFPTIDNRRSPLTGRVEGTFDTPPVTMPARAIIAPPPMYREWLEKAHPDFSLETNKMAENRLVIIYDKYDDTGRTLSSLGLQFTTISKRQVDAYDFTDAQVVVVDCGPSNISLIGMQKIRDFVARGGYLFTTDWMLDRLDQLIFPGYIAWNGSMNSQKMYDATIVGDNPVLFKHAVSNAYWKMDIHCHLIRVLKKDAVRVLAVSRTLMLDDPDHQGILAVVFPFGRGYVMHMTAHFDRSQQFFGFELPDPAPMIGISLRQAIAINYVVAGLTGTKP